jgi:tetratricopeptide (TPR) repeat protein
MIVAEKPRPLEGQDKLLASVREASARALAHAEAYEVVMTLEEARYATGIARRLGRLEESAKALSAAALAHYLQADLVEAVIRALDAVRRSDNEPDLARAWFVAGLAFLGVQARDIAAVAARHALEHAVKAGDEGLTARAHSCAGIVAAEEGRHEEAVLALYTATRIAQGAAERALYMKTLCNLARALRGGGDAQAQAGDPAAGRRSWRHAARLLGVALHVPASAGDVIIAKGLLGPTLLRLGAAPAAVATLQEGAALLGPDSVPWVVTETLNNLAAAQLAAGDAENAAATLERAALACKDPGAAQSRETCHLLHAELAGRLGRSDMVGVYQAYARTAKHHRDNEMESARRQALTLWQRFEASVAVAQA